MRSILGSFFLLAAASVATAQTPAQMMINNAPAGINIDVFIDAGKVQTVTVNQQGTAGFELDFLSLGKPQGQVYVEACKDGQRIRIITDGTTVPDDGSCNRRPVGVLFTFSCTRKITLDFAAAKASFAGCGTILTNKYFWGAVGGALVGVGVGVSGGGSGTTQPSVTSFTPPPQNTSVSQPAAQTPTTPAPTPTTIEFNGTYPVTSCRVISDPTGYEANVRLCSTLTQITISASGGGATITGNAPNFMRFGGTVNTTTGAFSLSSTGSIGPTSGVAATLVGTVNATGRFSAVYDVSTNGAIANGAHPVYQIEAQRQ